MVDIFAAEEDDIKRLKVNADVVIGKVEIARATKVDHKRVLQIFVIAMPAR